MYKMQFQGRSVLKFSCASGANNQLHQFSRMDARCIIATSETILNIVKKFVRKLFQAIRKFFICTPPPPPHSSEVRYGPVNRAKYCEMYSENHVFCILRRVTASDRDQPPIFGKN